MDTQPSKRNTTLIVGVVVAVALIAALAFFYMRSRSDKAVSRPAPSQAAGVGSVKITEDGFVPSTLRVKVGQTVTWTNVDSGPHRIGSNPFPVAAGAELDSVHNLSTNGTYSHTFNKAGTYQYHDEVDPKFNATIIVE